MRNVVVLCLDTVRKDTFDAYAPRLRRRAAVEFEQCRAASSWSVPSHASMLTGQLPHEHGVHTHSRDFSSSSIGDTFLDRLDDHRRVGASANVFAGSEFGFDDFFDRFVDVSPSRRFPDGLDPLEFRSDRETSGLALHAGFLRAALAHDRPLQSIANGITGYLDSATRTAPVPNLFDDGTAAVVRACKSAVDAGEEPFFLYANVMEAHTPLQHTLGYDRNLHSAPNGFSTDERDVWELLDGEGGDEEYLRVRRGLYEASVDYLDRILDRFLDWLERRTERETTVVITADHGENLGGPADEGLVRHKSSLGEGLLHVPLSIVNPPRGEDPDVSRYVSHLEFGRLVEGLAEGRLPSISRDRVPAEVVGMSAGPNPPSRRRYWDRMIRCAYEGESKYVWDSLGGSELYELDSDRPTWQHAVGGDVDVPEWARELFDDDIVVAKDRAVASTSPEDVDEATRSRLASLGYV